MKYLIGTLFQEEEIKQKTQFENMKAKDDKGHMRWEGAFTGGFTAGYKNTCGSKDGWAPTAFISSRDKRADQIKQDIGNFMDDQDMGKSKLAENIHLVGNYVDKLSNNPFNISIQQSIGQKILNRLKKNKAEQYQPKDQQQIDKLFEKYAKQQQIQKHQSQKYYQLKDKDDYTSLGYRQYQQEGLQDKFLEEYDELFNQVIRNKWKEETQEEKKKRREENKIYFDFTKPLEQQQDYLKQIIEQPIQSKPHKKIKLQIFKFKLDSLFVKQNKKKENQKQQLKIPIVPQDYDPYHKLKALSKNQQVKINNNDDGHMKKLKIENRKQILGQKTMQERVYNQKFVRAQQKLTNLEANNVQIEYQLMDPKKKIRYQNYILQMQGKIISGNNPDMDWKAAEKEREQFDKIYQKQISTKKDMTATAKTFKIQREKQKVTVQLDKIVRTRSSWRPQKLLCKRFGLLMPYNSRDDE